MAKFPKMPLWTDAYLADTTHLTTIQHGAYLLLLFAMWRAPDQRLPDRDETLARTARLTLAQWRRMRDTIAALCTLETGFWTSSRLRREFDAVKQHSESQRDKANARHMKNKDYDDAVAKSGMGSGNAPNPNPKEDIYPPISPLPGDDAEDGLNNPARAKESIEGAALSGSDFDCILQAVISPHGADGFVSTALSRGEGVCRDASPQSRAMPAHYLHDQFPKVFSAEQFAENLPPHWQQVLAHHIEPQWHSAIVTGFWEKWVGVAPHALTGDKFRKQNWLWAFIHSCQISASRGKIIANRGAYTPHQLGNHMLGLMAAAE